MSEHGSKSVWAKRAATSLPLRNPPFFGNLSHLLPNKMAERFSHKSVRVNIYPCPLVKKRGEKVRECFGFESKEALVCHFPQLILMSAESVVFNMNRMCF